MAERIPVNKPSRYAKRLADISSSLLADSFRRQGFASAELVTRWTEIVGAEIAEHAEPIRMQWRRMRDQDSQEPATLVLRVEGPAALEIQHLSHVILERVNRFFGWQAAGRIAIRQAPLSRAAQKPRRKKDPAAVARVAARLEGIADEDLRDALARLGAAVKQK